MSLNGSFQQLSAGLASFIAGVIITRGGDGKLLRFEKAGYLAALTSVACIFISRRLRPYREADSQAPEAVGRAQLNQ